MTMPLSSETCPGLAPGVRLSFDKARDRWVVLAPERVLVASSGDLGVTIGTIRRRTPAAAGHPSGGSRTTASAAKVTTGV